MAYQAIKTMESRTSACRWHATTFGTWGASNWGGFKHVVIHPLRTSASFWSCTGWETNNQNENQSRVGFVISLQSSCIEFGKCQGERPKPWGSSSKPKGAWGFRTALVQYSFCRVRGSTPLSPPQRREGEASREEEPIIWLLQLY